MRTITAAGMVSMLSLIQPASAAGCLKNGAPMQGTFAWVDAKHALNGTPIHAPFVILKSAICVEDSGFAKGTRVQLFLKEPKSAKGLKQGSLITVVGKYEPPMTPWNIGDIIAFDAKIVRVEKA